MITLIFFLGVPWLAPETCCTQCPSEWPGSSGFTFLARADLGWWHRPSLIVQSSAQIRTRILAIRENTAKWGAFSDYCGEIAFNCVPSVKCCWSWPLSWLSLLFSIFAARGISKLQEKSVSLQANGEMLGWVHRCFLTELISWLLLQCETRSLSPNVTNCLPSCKTVKVCD